MNRLELAATVFMITSGSALLWLLHFVVWQ